MLFLAICGDDAASDESLDVVHCGLRHVDQRTSPKPLAPGNSSPQCTATLVSILTFGAARIRVCCGWLNGPQSAGDGAVMTIPRIGRRQRCGWLPGTEACLFLETMMCVCASVPGTCVCVCMSSDLAPSSVHSIVQISLSSILYSAATAPAAHGGRQ